MNLESIKKTLIIAGPNGAGKTTFAREFLPDSQGGHNIPEPVIRRRFASGQFNLARYCALVDDWDVYDNSGLKPVLISERTT